MSIRIMSAVWEINLPPSEKLVLLGLADWANDDGWCHPSIATVARKTGVSERTVQRVLRDAETAGHLTRQETIGKGCKYRLHPRHSVTPDTASPVTNGAETPDTVSPNTSVTVISNVVGVRERAILASPQWKAFKAMRRDIKKPINPTSEKRLLAKLLALDDDGYPPGDVLEQSTENCWRGVFPIKDDDDGRQTHQRRSMGGPRPDPTLALVRSAVAAQR